MKNKAFKLSIFFLLSLLITSCGAPGEKGDKGPQGEKGDTGAQGETGDKGSAGKDGRSILSIIPSSADGVTNFLIVYSDGATSYFTVKDGKNGEQGIQGVKGADGHSPVVTIGDNGNWVIDGVDSGFSSVGEKGNQGPNGVSITKTEIINGDLIVTYSTGATYNAGHLVDAVNSYSVNYYINDELVLTKTAKENSKINKPYASELGDKNIDTWFVEGYQDRAWVFDGYYADRVTDNLNLYAYEVSLSANDITVKKEETKTLYIDASSPILNTTYSFDDCYISEAYHTVDSFTFSGLLEGETTIEVKCQFAYGYSIAYCGVTVEDSTFSYMDWCATWSKPGHVYLHYLRKSDLNYDPWAVFIWQKVPEDSEGTFWGATHNAELNKVGITTVTNSWMTAEEVGKEGSNVYCDNNGQIVDINVSRTDLVGAKTGVPTSFKTSSGDWCERCGFLIIDQTSCTGKSHWKSDGGIEAYIKKFDELMYDTATGEDKFLHIFCIEGQVTDFTISDGQPIEENPTIKDQTGAYRSKNDISNLLRDSHPGYSTPTSTTFLDDRPGVGYQIFVPSFADGNGDGLGDLGGIITKLNENYFKDLGVDSILLSPIFESDTYDGSLVSDYYKIDSKFGTLDQYKALIQTAHSQGIKVLMDMPIVYTSKNSVLFSASEKAGIIVINNKTYNARDMFLWKFKGDRVREWNGQEVPYGSPITYETIAVENSEDWYRDGESNYYYNGKFGSGTAALNYSCEATRSYMQDMCKWWLEETKVDGFSFDEIKYAYLESELSPTDADKYLSDFKVYDAFYSTYYDDERGETITVKQDYSYDRDLNVKFWKEFAWNIKADYPNCFFVGENFDGWNERMAPFYESVDSLYDFSTYYHLNEMPANAIGSDLKTSLEIYYNDRTSSDAINGAFTSNQYIPRMMNHAAAATFSTGSAHHTEINNNNYQKAINQARFDAALTILSPGLSWIYYGDELGMTGNTNDKMPGEIDDHGNNLDRWYRQPMKWTNELGASDGSVYTVNYSFSGLHMNWDSMNFSKTKTVSEQKTDSTSMLNYFIALGKAKSDKRYPTYGWITWAGHIGNCDNSCEMEITDGTRTVRVFINNSDYAVSVPEIDQMDYMISGSVGASLGIVPAHGFLVVTNQLSN